MAITFTDEQQECFKDGYNLLVSASAGSGKTTVMIERIVRLLLKYKNSDNPLSISNFLIVTFTKASASDMKQKLISTLSDLKQDDFILEQIEKVSTSDISNLHSFCSRLINSYFYEIGIDPAVHIIDDLEASFLKDRALDKLFEKKEREGDIKFFELFDIFQKKRSDDSLRHIIKLFDSNIKENIDGDQWFINCVENCYNENLEKNVAASIINKRAVEMLKPILYDLELLIKESGVLEIQKLTDMLIDLSSELSSINKNNSFLVNSKNIFDIKIKAVPKIDEKYFYLEERVKAFLLSAKNIVDSLKNSFISCDEVLLKQGLNTTKEIVVKLYELTKEFNEIYDKLKKEANGVDFHDLEHYALKILENDKIRETIKQKYRYVLVDEYQDINAIQEKIISLISSSKNRFMVGDVKQSIYRFRFCDPDIFLQKFALYEKGGEENKLIKLNCNFRSDKKILKFVDKIFCETMTENFGGYDYQKNSIFVAGESNLDKESAVNLCFINTDKKIEESIKQKGIYSVKNHKENLKIDSNKARAEAVYVANKIAEIMNNNKDVKFSDFAVLVSSRNENVYEFIETLKNFDILVAADRKYDLMEMTHIQDLVNFAKICVNKNDDITLFKVLKGKLFNFSDNELANIRASNQIKKFYEVVFDFDSEDLCLSKKIKNFNIQLEKYIELSKIMTIKDFMQKIIEDFDLLLINMATENGNKNCEDINFFINKLPDIDVFDYINLYADYSLVYESDCNGDAVKVMTIHKSKGIEFKYVFLVNLAKEFNFQSLNEIVMFNKNLGIGVDAYDVLTRTQMSSLPIAAIKLIEKQKLIEEQQRLLYVAMTRAVEKLFVVCSCKENKLTDKFTSTPNAFVDWFMPIIKNEIDGNHCDFVNFEKFDIDDLLVEKLNSKNQLLIYEEEINDSPNWFNYKYNKLKNIALKNSISNIIKDVFDDKNYDNISVQNISSSDRGTLYHKVMQSINLNNLVDIDNQLDKILMSFNEEDEKIIDRNKIKNVLNLEFFKQIKQEDVIYYEREFFAKMPTKMIDEETSNDYFIMQGIVDLLVFHDDEIWILDYKTGIYNKEKEKKYKFQIDAYANVIERSFNKKVTRKILCFIDEQKNIEF